MISVRWCLIAAALTALSACRDPFAPPSGSSPFVPPQSYRTAWQEVEECSGLRGDFTRVEWFVV